MTQTPGPTTTLVWVRRCLFCHRVDGRERWASIEETYGAGRVRPWSREGCGAVMFLVVAAQQIAQPNAIPDPPPPAVVSSRRAQISDARVRDLAAVVRLGQPIAPVLRGHGVGRQSYYRLVWIGSDHSATWSDGSAVAPADLERCRVLVLTLAEARVDRETAELARLRQRRTAGYGVTR